MLFFLTVPHSLAFLICLSRSLSLSVCLSKNMTFLSCFLPRTCTCISHPYESLSFPSLFLSPSLSLPFTHSPTHSLSFCFSFSHHLSLPLFLSCLPSFTSPHKPYALTFSDLNLIAPSHLLYTCTSYEQDYCIIVIQSQR